MSTSSLPQFHLYTDASGSIGYGACMGKRWLYGSWDDGWWREQNIMLLELYPIWLALKVWCKELVGTCVLVRTDNLVLVPVVRLRRSKLRLANALLREISLVSMRHNIIIKVEHIAGVDNVLADSLSLDCS